jgi:exoribonuclease-2
MNSSETSLFLKNRVRDAMRELGFTSDFPTEVNNEVENVQIDFSNCLDLTHLLWSSIDNEESRDLDQVEFLEKNNQGSFRLLIGIADVDCAVKKNSQIDQHAALNTTSIYTGVETFPMLPQKISNDLTSLLENVNRIAIIIEMEITPSGELSTVKVYRAIVRNQAKLVYESVGVWLSGSKELPSKVDSVKGLKEQILLQAELSKILQQRRIEKGALTFDSMEPVSVLKDGQIIDLKVSKKNPAREIIECFMITSNEAMAEYLRNKKVSSIRRVVRVPKRWDRICEIAKQLNHSLPPNPDAKALSEFLFKRKTEDPDHFPDLSLSIIKLLGPGEYVVEQPGNESVGHFGLASHDYTHSTAPNRRYPDLIIQRQVKSICGGIEQPYSDNQLLEIANHCTEREAASRKLERLVRKVVAAVILRNRIGETFEGIVTGASPKGTFVRLQNWPAEGCVVKNKDGLDVGDKISVRLLSTDPHRGFIDFEKLNG